MSHDTDYDRRHPAYAGTKIEWVGNDKEYLLVNGERLGALFYHDGYAHLLWYHAEDEKFWWATECKIPEDEARYIVEEVCISLYQHREGVWK